MQDEFAKCIEHQFPLRRQNVSFYRLHFSEHKYHLFTQINNKSLRGAAGFLSHWKCVKVNIHDVATFFSDFYQSSHVPVLFISEAVIWTVCLPERN